MRPRASTALLPKAAVAAACLAACAVEPPPNPRAVPPAPVPTVTAPAAPPPPAREDGRLPPLARAERYDLSLLVDPGQPRFSGTVRILVQLPAETQYVILNSRGLTVSKAAAQVQREVVSAQVATRSSHGGRDPEELVLTFDRPLPAGEAVLDLAFEGPFNEALAGLYRVNEGGKWYAFTQFEATDARRAFPSFDEPNQKVPFDVHITAPRGLLAFSNMPETARSDRGETTTFDFATTPPLPTYLVAFAVGDFDVRQGETSPVPIRLITTKGKSGLGDIALADTAAILKELAGYFHVAYPYPKLDVVAVPNFAAGAMENAGFITFREELLLLDPAHAPQRARREVASVIAHEEAHQWFGDLVTTGWWDDIWLNEGFATWAEAKIVELYKPGYHARLEQLAELDLVMTTDSLKSARAVRQPVHSTGEAMESFDGITYQKGAAVLGMIEHMVGSDVFQRGVEAYLRDNAWKSVTASELLAALSKASGRDVGKLAATFLDRPGVPSVAFAFDCGAKPPTLTMTQTPWHLLGDARAQTDTAPWIVPTDFRANGEELRVVLPGSSESYPIPKCPAWVDPNVGGYGYYRPSLDEKRWTALGAVIAAQPETARLAFVTNLWAQVRAGSLAPDVALRLLPALDAEPSRVVIDAEIAVLAAIKHDLVSPQATSAFATYVSSRLMPHKRALDAKVKNPKTPLTEDEALERRSVFRALGGLADDPGTLEEANKLALAWLSEPTAVDGDLAQAAVPLGSRRAGPDRIEALRAAAKRAKTPSDKQIALAALSGFDDPAVLDKALGVALTDDVASQDVFTIVWGALGHPSTRALATRWILTHWDALRGKLPADFAGYAFSLAGEACTQAEVDEARSFLTPKVPDVEGSARPLAEGLETAELCRAFHDKDSAAVDRFLKVKAK